jgi:hypothetical protein
VSWDENIYIVSAYDIEYVFRWTCGPVEFRVQETLQKEEIYVLPEVLSTLVPRLPAIAAVYLPQHQKGTATCSIYHVSLSRYQD